MHILISIIAAAFLAAFGYFALWTSAHPATPKGVASFGRILAIILFVIAGLAFVSPVAVRHFHNGSCHGNCMMNRMEFRGHPGFMGHHPGPWMNGMQTPGERNGQEKPETPASK